MNSLSLDLTLRAIATHSINGYQRYLSPRKGFSCAHRLLYRGESCSQYIKQVIADEGLLAGLQKAKSRFQACRVAHQHLLQQSEQTHWSITAATSEEETEENHPRSRKRANHWTLDDGCASCGSTSPDCSIPDCNVLECGEGCDNQACDSGSCSIKDCTIADCNGWDCGGLDCSGLDCSGLDCGGCSSSRLGSFALHIINLRKQDS